VYVVNAFRFGMLGVSDVSVGFAFAMIGAFTLVAYLYAGASAQNRQTPENLTQMAGVLGQAVAAPERYAPEVLEPISRQQSAAALLWLGYLARLRVVVVYRRSGLSLGGLAVYPRGLACHRGIQITQAVPQLAEFSLLC
jgi:hypothetical protein